jgi:ABC-type phosphate/phosphonate transport system substrate-binding protein
MGRNRLALLAALLCAAPAWAQDLVMGVSEGTSGGLDHAQVIIKYQGLADVLSRSIKRKVNVVFVREFAQLEDGMKQGRLDFVIARPSDYPARGVKLYGYHYLASAKPDGQCLLVTGKDSGIKTIADMKGKRIVLPEPAAYMTKFCKAELRDMGLDLAKEKVQYVREQGAVAFYIDNKFADVGGIASYSGVAKKWAKDGGVVFYRSRTQPYFPLIAAKHVTEAQRAEIRKSLEGMKDNPADLAVLKTIGIEGFDTTSGQRLVDLLDWLGPQP